MIKRAGAILFLLIIFSNTVYVNAEDFNYIEIFDPQLDKVVKVVPLNPSIQNMVTNWIENIDGLYGKNDPVTDDGYAVRIPLNPSVDVHNKWLNSSVNQVYILIPAYEPPFYMIFDDNGNLCCYPFNGNIQMLSKSLNFELISK